MKYALHTEALAWLRYGKRMPVVCTEVGRWNADVLGLNASMCIEVEVKKSIADLRAEFRNKPSKHFVYNGDGKARLTGGVPNYFYFFVPHELADKAVEVAAEKAPKAGVAAFWPASRDFGMGRRNVEVIKRATRLHDKKPSPATLRAALLRMSSEICGLRMSMDKLVGAETQPISEILKQIAFSSSTLDFEDFDVDLERRGAEIALAVDPNMKWTSLSHMERIRWIFAAQRLQEAQRSLSTVEHEEIS